MGHLPQSTLLVLGLFTAFLAVSVCGDGPITTDTFNCPSTGLFSRPSDKTQYYKCIDDPNEPNKYHPLLFRCLKNKCFDSATPPCSEKACNEGRSEEPFGCIRKQMTRDIEKSCQPEVLEVLKQDYPRTLDFVASQGDPLLNLQLSLRDVNADMKETYAKRIETTGKNVFPLMIATDGEPGYFGVGGTYKVFLRNGTMWRINPVRPGYEIFKCLGHIPRGVFAIVSPFFKSPNSINWIPQLQQFGKKLENVKYLLENEKLDLSQNDSSVAKKLLDGTLDYIKEAVSSKSASIEGFTKYAQGLAHDIEASMKLAARYQAEDTIPTLLKLKERMGEDWEKMYVLIPNVWPMSKHNVRLQALARVMSFNQIKSQVMMVEGSLTDDAAKITLGRIIFDRVAAQLFWGGMTEDTMKDHVFSLSTKRDLVSTAVCKEHDNVCKEIAEDPAQLQCPIAGIGLDSGRFPSFGDEYHEIGTMTM